MEGDTSCVSFDELLSKSDILSLNIALNATMRHIISAPEFRKMKHAIIILNIARGSLIDKRAVISALDSGKVSMHALLFEPEPWSRGFEISLKGPIIFPVFLVGLDVYENEPAY